MDIYVGNLSREVTQEELRKEFMAFGRVTSVKIIKDRDSGRPRGFGFVNMPAKSEGQAAITGLNEKTLKGQTLKVNEARPRPDRRGKLHLLLLKNQPEHYLPLDYQPFHHQAPLEGCCFGDILATNCLAHPGTG